MIIDSIHAVIAQDIIKIAKASLPWEDLRDSTVLITGANGMIASYLVYTLLYLNDTKSVNIHVVAMVRNAEKAFAKMGGILTRKDITLLTQDVCSPLNYDGSVDIVIHAASPANPRHFSSDPVGTINANVLGTSNLLEFARKKQNCKFLFVSSSEVYGKAPCDGLISEDVSGMLDCASARSCYPESKRLAETYCAAYAQQYGMWCRAVRVAHMFGPSMDRDDGHVYAEFMRNVLEGKDIVLKSEGLTERAYTYVSDVALGLFTVLLKGQDVVYNLTNEDQVVSVKALAQMMIDSYPEKKLRIVYDIPAKAANTGFLPYRMGLLSSSRLRALGWSPTVSLAEGLERTMTVLGGSG